MIRKKIPGKVIKTSDPYFMTQNQMHNHTVYSIWKKIPRGHIAIHLAHPQIGDPDNYYSLNSIWNRLITLKEAEG